MYMFIIRDMKPQDCALLAELDKQVFSIPLSERVFEREFTNPDSTTLVAETDGRVIGYANLWNICGEVTLNNIAVIESERSKGAGTLLMREALSRFSGCDFITLEVRASNDGAIRFYKRFGFVQVGKRKNFYDKPVEDALLMTVALGDVRR